ncbi:hypothetical protein BRAO285_1230038 [Bradyrhizobium sp. ORS 285]|nr:hypothetical protein BRAO285_1230038 [Bradyrhizobium sp. ORS 285]
MSAISEDCPVHHSISHYVCVASDAVEQLPTDATATKPDRGQAVYGYRRPGLAQKGIGESVTQFGK